VAHYFQYELTTTPCSLFHGYVMNKATKSSLGKILKVDVEEDCFPNASDVFVIDGSALLHHVKWLRNVPLSDIASQYTGLVRHRYGKNCIVVFDGYGAGASTKDHEHRRRLKKAATVLPDVLCSPDIVVTDNQQAFLGNQHNKVGFIRVLSDCFRQEGYAVVQSKGDADTDIRVRTILALGYWVLGNICRYWVVLLLGDIFFIVTPNTIPIRQQSAPST